MGEKKEESEKTMTGCGGIKALYNTVFGRRGNTSPRKSSSANPTPRSSFSSAANSKRRRGGSDQSSLIVPHVNLDPPISPGISRLSPNSQITQISVHKKVVQRQIEMPVKAPPLPLPSISGELESVIYDHQQSKACGNLVRASSSNVMLFGSLGNLRGGNSSVTSNHNVFDFLPMTADEMALKGKIKKEKVATAVPPTLMSTCRVLSKRFDPESLKDLGDVKYENGRFAEALTYYEQASMVNPDNSSYWVNKAAALAGLGRFLEAVNNCREAVRIEPSNSKAHLRLAALYLR